jgi:hypothetical protein
VTPVSRALQSIVKEPLSEQIVFPENYT